MWTSEADGGELIARPPAHRDMQRYPAGLWGHNAIPGNIDGDDTPALRVAAGAKDWAELARDYDQEFPTDPAGWHFGHAFQDLQAVQHKHELVAPAAGR